MSAPSWEKETEILLVQLWNDKVPAGEIALQILQRYKQAYTRNAIIGKAHRMGLPKRGRLFKAESQKPKAERTHPISLPKAEKPKAFKMNPQNHTIAPAPSQPLWQPEPEPDNIVPIGQGCSLLQLENDKCHWPLGDPQQKDFFFCGGKAVSGLLYCGYHARIAYNPREPRR